LAITTLCHKEPLLRQLFAGVASGCHSSPGLKARGFLAVFYKYDSRRAKGDVAYQRSFDLMPNVDHVNPDSDVLALEICSRKTNLCKGEQTPEEFIAMCAKVADYCAKHAGKKRKPDILLPSNQAILGNPPKYFPPAYMTGRVTPDLYRLWIRDRSNVLFHEDKRLKRPYALNGSRVLYKMALHQAAARGQYDPFTGELIQWELIRQWKDIKGLLKEKAFWLMPTADHTDPASASLELEICSWRINTCKNDLSAAEFIELCNKVVDYAKQKAKGKQN
jgi:hypothetical protein